MTELDSLHPVIVDRVELRRVAMPLVAPFRTSFGVETERDILLVNVHATANGEPVSGWGECVALAEPTYSAEYVDAAQRVTEQHLLPRLAVAETLAAADVGRMLSPIHGHPMAKGAIEAAVLDAQLRAAERSFADLLGVTNDGTPKRIPSGVSVGIHDEVDDLLATVQGYLDDGYVRIKLKIEPGSDIEHVAAVRELIGPDTPLQVDANTAYRRTDGQHLARLDEYDLLLIEQPLPEEDIIGHAMLAAEVETPICLDESLVSAAGTADAIDLGACEIANIKPGRVGGYLEAIRIHDLCLERGIPVWCGGMIETGIGRGANAALAALPGFTLPGDISASNRFYAQDIVMDPIQITDGHVTVPTTPGMGFDIDAAILDSVTTTTSVIEF